MGIFLPEMHRLLEFLVIAKKRATAETQAYEKAKKGKCVCQGDKWKIGRAGFALAGYRPCSDVWPLELHSNVNEKQLSNAER